MGGLFRGLAVHTYYTSEDYQGLTDDLSIMTALNYGHQQIEQGEEQSLTCGYIGCYYTSETQVPTDTIIVVIAKGLFQQLQVHLLNQQKLPVCEYLVMGYLAHEVWVSELVHEYVEETGQYGLGALTTTVIHTVLQDHLVDFESQLLHPLSTLLNHLTIHLGQGVRGIKDSTDIATLFEFSEGLTQNLIGVDQLIPWVDTRTPLPSLGYHGFNYLQVRRVLNPTQEWFIKFIKKVIVAILTPRRIN